MKLFTLNPAKVIGLDYDRGSLKVGKRAGPLTVHHDGTVPRIMSVIREGNRIA